MALLALHGSVVAVTGGARGIGLATARALIERGARVALGDIDLDLARDAAAQLGPHALALPLDVRRRASFEAFLAATEERFGPLDALVNNAGIMPSGDFLAEPDGMSDAQIDVNLRGVILGCKVALPRLLAHGRGHIVNVASMAGRLPVPGLAVYCATKFAVVGLTETLAEEYRDSGVDFTAVLPAKVTTELAAGTERAGRGIPTVSAEDVAAAIVGALDHPVGEVTVPRYLKALAPLQSSAPRPVLRTVRRALGDRRILNELDAQARAGYTSRIARLAVTDAPEGGSVSAASSGHEQPVDVLIIGAGISGIGAAIVLREHGFDDLLILEKADALGGTWRDNTYPGCACDVPSALYSYSFAQRADWSRAFAGQAEILAYVQDTAERFDVRQRIRFGEPLESARWDDARGRWTVRTPRGQYAARILISCAGYLHEPQLPDVPGLDAFEGPVFHSSRWDHGVDLRGKRVAVVGTGASAVQFVPRIQPKVAELVLFQRTPHWVLPKPNPSMPAASQQLLDLPRAKETLRAMLYRGFEGFGVGFRHPELLRRLQFLGEAHIARAVRDPALREVLTPRYTLGCKRVLLSNDYYPALAQPNVTVLPTGLGAVRGDVVVGSDGTEQRADVIILGTGFHVSDPPIAERIQRADGCTLAQVWNGSPEAHRGTAIAGFPNAFLVLGPNLAIGNNSAFVVIESQLRYITAALSWMRRTHTDVVEVRADRQAAYNAEVQRDLAGTVWNTGGCQSYYLDANGRNSIGFPWSTDRMQALLAEFDHDNYDKRSPRAARGHVATTRA